MAGATLGAVTLQLGRLATALGRFDDAERWLEDARTRHREVGAGLLAAEADAALARLPRGGPVAVPAPVEAAAAFLRAGRLWAVTFRGTEATVPDSKGMRDLAVLIARPHREVHVLDLVEAAGGPAARTAGGDPVEALANLRRWLKPDGTLVIMDENVGEDLSAPGDEVERFFAAASVLWCTPQAVVVARM